jgi:hypothetical protein
MKNRVYYHTYLDDYFYWAHIFTDQMCMMEKDALLANVDKVKITAISKKDNRLDIFTKLCKSFPVNIELEFVESKYANDFEMLEDWSHLQNSSIKPISETYTHAKIYDDCKHENLNVFYLHAKAVTSISNCLIKYGHASKFKNRHLWRQLMNWGTITYWRHCVNTMKEYDAVGVDYQTTPPHFRGGFWWSKSDHIRSLPDPRDDVWWNNFKSKSDDPWIRNLTNRFRDEFWICSKENTKAFNIRPNNGYYVENDI